MCIRDSVRAYRDITKRIDPELPKLFGKLPRLTYGVSTIPSYAAPSQTAAYYQGGSPEAHRAGQFFVNTYKLDSRPTWEMDCLLYTSDAADDLLCVDLGGGRII